MAGHVQIALRVSPQLRDRIHEAAAANGRSANTELLVTLEAAYPVQTAAQRIAELEAEIARLRAREGAA